MSNKYITLKDNEGNSLYPQTKIEGVLQLQSTLNNILTKLTAVETQLTALSTQVNSGTVNNSNHLGGWGINEIFNESQAGGKWHRITMTNTSTERTGFYRVANITMTEGYGSYTASKIVGYLYDHNGNWAQSQSYKIPFQCIINISGDAGYLYTNTTYGDTNHLRLVKLATRTYELQARCNAAHCDFDVYYTVYRNNGVTCYDTLVPASEGGTVLTNSSITCWQ